MPQEQDQLANGHTPSAVTDAAAAVHVPAAATGHGKEPPAAAADAPGAAASTAAPSSDIDGAAAPDGAHRRHRHRHDRRPPRAPAPEMTGTGDDGSGRCKYDDSYDAFGPRERDRGSFSATVHHSLSKPRTNAVVINGRHRHRATAGDGYSSGGGGASSYHAADDYGGHAAAASTSSSSRHAVLDERLADSPRRQRPPAPKPHGERYSAAANGVPRRGTSGCGGGVSMYESPPAVARPNGIVTGGNKHRYHQAAGGSSPSGGGGAGASRLNREPVTPPRHHVPKPARAHGAPSSSAASASVAAREEHDDAAAYKERCYRAGIDLAKNIDLATLMSLAKQHADRVMGQWGNHQQQQPAAEQKTFSFWLTDEEAEADLKKVKEYYSEEERTNKAADGNVKRRRH
ncbi:unnamed protein product [Urochloa humidicola]